MKTKRRLSNSKNDRKNPSLMKKNTKVLSSGVAALKQTFNGIVSRTKKYFRKLKPKCKKIMTKLAYEATQEMASDLPMRLPRVIPVPKTGGFLPLIPIFAGLSLQVVLLVVLLELQKPLMNIKQPRNNLLN